MKRVVTVILVLTMLTGLLSGCKKPQGNASGDKSSGSSTSSKSEIIKEERKKQDFGGKEILIKTWDGTMFDYTEGESDTGDAILKAIAKVEDELNCKLVFEYETPEEMLNNASATILSGEKYADIIVPIYFGLTGFITSGLLQDFNEIPGFDAKKEYWDKKANEIGTINGKQYFGVNALNGTYAGGTSCVFFNKRIIKEMQLENPYDLVKNNQWTIEKFREMAKKAMKNLDGQSAWTANDQWGIAALDERHTFTGSILAASDAPYLIKDDKGVIKYNAAHPKVINAFKLAQDICFNDKTMLKGGTEVTDMQFINGKALFYPFYLWKIKPISEMEDDFGIVPFPKLKPEDDYHGHMEWNRSVFAVPAALPEEDLKQVGAVLDAIAYHSQGRTKTEMDEFKNRYFRDDESGKMLELVEKSATLEYSQFLASSSNPALYEATYSVQYALMDNIANDPYKFFDEVKNKGKTAVQDFMNSLK